MKDVGHLFVEKTVVRRGKSQSSCYGLFNYQMNRETCQKYDLLLLFLCLLHFFFLLIFLTYVLYKTVDEEYPLFPMYAIRKCNHCRLDCCDAYCVGNYWYFRGKLMQCVHLKCRYTSLSVRVGHSLITRVNTIVWTIDDWLVLQPVGPLIVWKDSCLPTLSLLPMSVRSWPLQSCTRTWCLETV